MSAKISIITPSYNAAAVIETCLKSVALQSYPNKEHWIIDAQSKDDTVNIVKRYQAQYPHIKLVSEADKGIWDAMNKGIDLSAGEWLFFMGADDAMDNENALSTVFGQMSMEQYDVIYGNIRHRESGKVFDDEFNVALLARFNIAHQAIFYRKSLFEKIGKFSLNYISSSDYAFNIKWFGNDAIRRKYIKEVICIYDESGLSSRFFDKAFYRDKLKLLQKYLKFESPGHFTDAARYAIYTQLRNGDITGALLNLGLLFKHAEPSFNKWLFTKEFLAITFKRPNATLGEVFREKELRKN